MHESVLLKESVEALAIKPSGLYIDATFGRGGHSQHILQHLGPKGRLIAIDKDSAAIEAAAEKFKNDARFSIVQASFADIETLCQHENILNQVDGVLFDLGVSSPQLDEAERGFSFMHDGPLDMRMDQRQTLTAEQWINSASEQEIADVIYQYGEERYSRRLAKVIVLERKEKPITRTGHLAELIKTAHPKWEKHKHPATRSFQAIRIFINRELDDLKTALLGSVNVLKTGGRLVVISFHSLEDRIVKQFIQREAKGETLPRGLPIRNIEQHLRLKRLSKAIKPSKEEVERNVRSRSSVLRIAEKISGE